MKTIITLTIAFLTTLTCVSLAQDIIPAEVIAKKLNESIRGGKVEKRTQQFSSKAYKELNPDLNPATRGIQIVATENEEHATVSVDSSAHMTFENIRFKLNSIELADEASAKQLIAIAEALKKIGKSKSFVIEGHTCDLGAEQYNQKLSEKRALVVGLFFRDQGVECELVPFGYGEKDPTNANASEDQRQVNRRVVVRKKA